MAQLTTQLEKHIDKLSSLPVNEPCSKELALNILNKAQNFLDKKNKFSQKDTSITFLLHRFLNLTGRSRYLKALPSMEDHHNWTSCAFKAIRCSNYDFGHLILDRTEVHPNRLFLHDPFLQKDASWTYLQISQIIKKIAATIYQLTQKKTPKVALVVDNSIKGASIDLACLTHDIFNTLLSIHLEEEEIRKIFDDLEINLVFIENFETFQLMEKIKKKVSLKFKIVNIADSQDEFWSALKSMTFNQAHEILEKRKRRSMDQMATCLFTSGSTGSPKGVCFSIYNLVSKRFARAAAIPYLGEQEVFLSYLPFFHTFGRYLELLGSLYWGGTYVLLRNPSLETLLNLLPKISPTVLISIPLRWQQIYQECIKRVGHDTSKEIHSLVFREVVGKRLRFGLSAAGYLDPRVFHYIRKNGVDLCSGFGMTESTGGITMTPPKAYVPDSVGIPLPGIKTKFTKEGELLIGGDYVARYLDPKEDRKEWPVISPYQDNWISTGDIFLQHKNGHLQIVDRIKDIYKNKKGQTVAPNKVEKKFYGVPGIKRTFLVGDGREYNTLLIVQEDSESAISSQENQVKWNYFNRLITEANQQLAPYERVIKFVILPRDFTIEKEELTPKGTFRRKIILENFYTIIKGLYQKDYSELYLNDLTIRIPRWFYRDLSILEGQIKVAKDSLINEDNKKVLKIKLVTNNTGEGIWTIGDLNYNLSGKVIDIGILCKQPILWMGNPELMAFSPCKDGLEVNCGPFSKQVLLEKRTKKIKDVTDDFRPIRINNVYLFKVNNLFIRALFHSEEEGMTSLAELEDLLTVVDERIITLIRHRLESLCNHPAMRIRAYAYRILLLDEPTSDYGEVFSGFLKSGLPYLDDESINLMTQTKLEKRRLGSLRKRLANYRKEISNFNTKNVVEIFKDTFILLANFSKCHLEYYSSVRAELSMWVLQDENGELSQAAEDVFLEHVKWYQEMLKKNTPRLKSSFWEERVIFDEGIKKADQLKLKKVIYDHTFVKQSLILAFDLSDFDLKNIVEGGIWVSVLPTYRHQAKYRLSINTTYGKHYDLLLIFRGDISNESVVYTKYLFISLAGYPFGPPIVPNFGCYRQEMGVLAQAYYDDLTVWEQVRSLQTAYNKILKRLFIRGMSTFFQGWFNSNSRIIPGIVDPTNVAVPNLDFREGAKILSLWDWSPYKNTFSLIGPLIRNFYIKTLSHFPKFEKELDFRWIFDACLNGLGKNYGRSFLYQLSLDLKGLALPAHIPKEFSVILDSYLKDMKRKYRVPLSLENAINRFSEWSELNPEAILKAQEELLEGLYALYSLERFGEMARYYLYRHTIWSDAPFIFTKRFDVLLDKMFKNPKVPAIRMLELSSLQSMLKDHREKKLFNHMVFPSSKTPAALHVEVVEIGTSKEVIVKSRIYDHKESPYDIRRPLDPLEIGKLYRLFFKEGHPLTLSREDSFLVMSDFYEQIMGGICYKKVSKRIIQLKGIVIASPLNKKGLYKDLLEDFIQRMSDQGFLIVKTHFFMRSFFLNNNFKVSRRLGGLVRFLRFQKRQLPI